MTIKAKLWSIGLLAIAGLAVVFTINFYGSELIKQSLQIEEHALQLEVQMLQARRAEKDFLLRKDTKYINAVKDKVKNMNLHLNYLKNSELDEYSTKGLSLASSYEKQFMVVANDIIKLGLDENSGLVGKLRNAVHDAEKAVMGSSKLFEAGILQLRRNEKDFMMRVDQKYMDRFHKNMAQLVSDIKNSDFPAQRKQLVLGKLETYKENMDKFAQLTLSIKAEEDKFRTIIHSMEPLLDELAVKAEEIVHEQMQSIQTAILIAEVIATLILIATIILIIRSILTPLTHIQECALKVSKGDYEACDRISLSGELEILRTNIAEMVIRLKKIMDHAEEKSTDADREAENARKAMAEANSEKEFATSLLTTISSIAEEAGSITLDLNSAAGQLARQSKQIMEGADNQKYRVQETATAIDEMSATILEVANNASNASEGSRDAVSKANEGYSIVEQVAKATNQVQDNTVHLQEALAKQDRQAESIGKIMDVISDIADQTNLLALNAAIEAARAGDAGRGFAVVADEVRKLAEKTVAATQEVGSAISGIQEGTSSSLSIMDTTGKAVSECAELADKAGQSLKLIVEIVSDSAHMVESIATATEQQSAAAEQINSSTTEINTISSEISEHVTESAEAAHSVSDLATKLQDLIEKMNNRRQK